MTLAYYALRQLTHRTYRIKGIGLGRLSELVRRMAAKYARQTPFLIEDFRGDAKFMCYLKEHMGGHIFFRGSYSEDQLLLMEKLVDSDSVFIDAGANQGEFSVAAARIIKHGQVIALEPVAEYRDRLLENSRINNFGNIRVITAALGDREGSLPIFDRPDNFEDGTRNEGLPSLFSSESRRHARELVAVRRLDDVLKEFGIARVDLIKLDIEGAEWMALRGAVDTIAVHRPKLILEIGRETCRAAGYEPEAFVGWLMGQKYRIEKIVEHGKTQPIVPDLLDDFQNVIAYPI